MQKSATSPTPSLMVPTASCCRERPPRELTLSNPVRDRPECERWLTEIIVLMMAETCLISESAICYPALYDELKSIQPRPTDTAETVAIAAVSAASEQKASAIVVLSTSGETARLIAKYRPLAPIICGASLSCRDFLCDVADRRARSDPKRADFAPGSPAPWMLPVLVPRTSRCP